MHPTAETVEGAVAHKGSGRVTVNLSPRASEALEQLSRMTGESKTDSINKALQLFAYVQQVQSDNGAIYVREPGSKEPERLRIF